jgi:hypothetical protein
MSEIYYCPECKHEETVRFTECPECHWIGISKVKGFPTFLIGGVNKDKNNYAWRDRVKEQREVGKRIGIYDGKVE